MTHSPYPADTQYRVATPVKVGRVHLGTVAPVLAYRDTWRDLCGVCHKPIVKVRGIPDYRRDSWRHVA